MKTTCKQCEGMCLKTNDKTRPYFYGIRNGHSPEGEVEEHGHGKEPEMLPGKAVSWLASSGCKTFYVTIRIGIKSKLGHPNGSVSCVQLNFNSSHDLVVREIEPLQALR